jgi:GxxExxY protein
LHDLEDLARIAIDCGYRIHRDIGPGLLESAYEALLADLLQKHGLGVERQKILPLAYGDVRLPEAYRVDLLVEARLVIEVKSVERLQPLHSKQLLTYIRLAGQPVGILMNFGGDTFKEGVRRVVDGPSNFRPAAHA